MTSRRDEWAASMSACRRCGAAVQPTDAFCESCGAQLRAPDGPPVPAGSRAAATGAGLSARTHLIAPPSVEPSAPAAPHDVRAHVVECPVPTVAGISDIGRVHRRNEDALALAADPDGRWAALVVSDGVTTSSDSDLASLAAAVAARDVLAAARRPGPGPAAAPYWVERLIEAIAAAGDAAVGSAEADRTNPPSCTIVAAVLDADVITCGWIGDSRAYWLPDGGPGVQLSVDDSWASAQIAMGVDRVVAETGPRAHAITRWLGVGAPRGDASTATVPAREAGWLLVCSDGLWNYCSTGDELAALVRTVAVSEPFGLADALVAWANDQGGRDNITVAVARVLPPASGAFPVRLE